jgi:hypothetical protein
MSVVSADIEPLTLVFEDDGLVPNNPMPFLLSKGVVDVANAHPKAFTPHPPLHCDNRPDIFSVTENTLPVTVKHLRRRKIIKMRGNAAGITTPTGPRPLPTTCLTAGVRIMKTPPATRRCKGAGQRPSLVHIIRLC